MKKLNIIVCVMFIFSIMLSTSVFADDEVVEDFKEMKAFDINKNTTVSMGTGTSSINIFSMTSNAPNTGNNTHWEMSFGADVLQFDEYLYQVVPLDYTKAKEIVQLIDKARSELSAKASYIEEQEVLSQKENSNVTIAQVNVLIDEYNQLCTNKIQEIQSKFPQYNDNNWKELEVVSENGQNTRKMIYDDPTGNTAYVLAYAKVTYSKFPNEKTIYAYRLENMNYQYLSQNQGQNQNPNQDEEDNPQEEQKPVEDEKPTQNNNKNNDKTVAPTKLPKAGLKHGIIAISILVLVISIIFYKRYTYFKGIK